MSKSKFNPLIAASMMSAVCLAGVTNVSNAVVLETDVTKNSNSTPSLSEVQLAGARLAPANALGQRRYIVQLNEQPVARYSGNGQFAPIPRKADNKLDVRSNAVQTYAEHLRAQQQDFLSSASSTLNRNVTEIFSYQFALNGVVIELTAEEASLLANNPQVKSVNADREYEIDTDAGPQLIGADNVWQGSAPAAGSALGEGVVIGVLDTGANYDHPSFADVGGDGYDHTNPLGSGTYVGVCDPANADQFLANYTCNDKIIGGYDFVFDITPGTGFDLPGPEDEVNHGTHTASTAGGNVVLDAEINGVTGINISGVAPHANIIPFDVCFDPQGEPGGCFGSASVASIDQIIADGIVDVVNYSISGGTDPWGGDLELAFLSATDAGVFVSASAGNSGPGPATLGHLEPWTSSVGASTHNRFFESLMSITGPVQDPALENLNYTLGSGLPPVPAVIGDIVYAGDIDPANFEGCDPFPVDSLLGSVVLISRGSCAFADKVNNSTNAGAIAVVVHNNVAGTLNMGGLEGTTIPSVSILQADGVAMAAYITANPGATIEINAPIIDSDDSLADSMAAFSSRGPSNFEYNKPDVTGPGVNILAAFNDSDTTPGTAAEYGAISGTSMASPHNAGSAALLKELHPTWSVPEIKSALMLTAVTAGVTKEDGVTDADPFDRGAGRIQVDVASSTGLVLDETAFRFLMADPANGGDPKTLNVASYKNDNCEADCVFERTFRSVADSAVTYDASVTGLTGTVNPANFTVAPGQEVTLEVTIDGSASPIGETSFGELVLTPPSGEFELPIVIDDASYVSNDPIGNLNCSSMNVSGVSASDVMSVELGIDHTWVGDLTLKIFNPNGDELTLLSRPGRNGTGVGDADNLVSTSPITFSDAGVTDAELMGSAGGDVCAVDGLCDYFANPDEETSSLADFAAIVAAGDPNGTWQVCAGDSAAGDTGSIVTAALNFNGSAASLGEVSPELHLPLVIIGFPDQPIIGTTPTEINETLASDESTDVTVNISNAGLVADLNWNIVETGTVDNFTLNQPVAPGGPQLTGILDAFGGGGVYPADSFTVNDGSVIENVSISGVSNGGGNLIADADEVTVTIYADAGGVPAGHPEDGLNSDVFSLTLPVGDPSLDLDGGSGFVGVDILAATGSGLELPAGQYWVLVYPTVLNTNIFFWNQGVDASPGNVFRIDPNGLLGGGTDWEELTDVPALNVSISNELTCGAPWLTASLTSDVTGPSSDVDVTVSLDSTGLPEGVYRAGVCVANDDFDNSLVTIPVTMIVGPSDLIFENGFE